MAPSADTNTSATAAAVAYLIHHVLLPRKLPQGSDYNASHEQLLLETTCQALGDLKEVVRDEQVVVVDSAITAIESSMQSRDCEGGISEVQLHAFFGKLVNAKEHSFLPLEVKSQNAGIVIRRTSSDVVFEFFELAPTNEASMTKGRLIRNFPGLASSIPAKKMEEDLQLSLSRTISKMASQAAPGFQPQTRKAGHYHDETRDTTHPGMVTDFLMNVVTAVGQPAETIRITKHTREEIMWKGGLLPWRRSPLWLLVRVALQLHFTRNCENSKSPGNLYKVFMVFLVSRILKLATLHREQLNGDLIHTALSKLLRRYHKIQELQQLQGLKFNWAKRIFEAFDHAHSEVSSSWKSVTDNSDANVNLEVLKTIRPEQGFDIALPQLDDCLSHIASRQPSSPNNSFEPTSAHSELPAEELPQNFPVSIGDSDFSLLAVEQWIEEDLPTWTKLHANDSTTCGLLLSLVKRYHSLATATYAGVPDRMSIMYLNLLELWVACDTSACSLYPLLCKFDSGVSFESTQCLLLPLKSQMTRLHRIECYLESRMKGFSDDTPLINLDFGHESSFAVKYFEQSATLKAAMMKIETDAAVKRQEKLEEFKRLKQKYRDLMKAYDGSACTYVTRKQDGTRQHLESACSRCKNKREAGALNIEVFEWPLSPIESIAKATVFELLIPAAFSAWRDVCTYLMGDVLGFCGPTNSRPMRQYTLLQHQGFESLVSPQYAKQCIIPLSEVKPHRGTHFNIKQKLSVLQDQDLCPSNGLKYRYYDRRRKRFTGILNSTEDVSQNCTYKLPTQSKALETYLRKPVSAPDGTLPNEVMANLSDCPCHMSLDEFKAFGVLASGRHLLYSNILTQLAMPSVNFAKLETYCLVLQIVNQTGVPADDRIERTSHHLLVDASFGRILMEKIEVAFTRVAENWESWRASATFVQISRRLLSLTLSANVAQRCLGFLDSVRQTCLKWLASLQEKASSSSDNKQRVELHSRATEISFLCISTFDVEEKYLHDILQPRNAISTLLRSSVIIQENRVLLQKSEHLFATLMQSWKVLMHRVARKLQQSIIVDSSELDQLVLACWSAFQPGSAAGWKALPKPHEHWVQTTSGSLPVHFNVLTAELLVNGLPMAHLPSNYMAHHMYKPLFGAFTVESGPSDERGMSFSSKHIYQGYQLHFGMKESDLLVLAVKDGSRYDLLPARLFADHLPDAFVTNYYHWYDHSTETVIFQTREHPWLFYDEAAQWRLHKAGSCWHMLQGAHHLLNPESGSARTISEMFQPLEDGAHIHNMFDQSTHRIHIQLPRLKLDFHNTVGNTQIYSRQYRDLILDTDQTVGTLVGLRSKLVLRNENVSSERLLLVPEGTVEYVKIADHARIQVTVRKGTADKVYAYLLDQTFKRIIDTGNLQCRLFLAYLHALTSYHLPDPLTYRTGTESALELLRPKGILSYGLLTSVNIDSLVRIAKLSPSRVFYPHYLKEMQQINWNSNIDSMSQHGMLSGYVKEIFDQAQKTKVFYRNTKFHEPSKDQLEWLSSESRLFLQERDAIRSSNVRVLDYGGQDFTSTHDTLYSARDQDKDSQHGRRAFILTSMIVRKQPALPLAVLDLRASLKRKYFSGTTVSGANISVGFSELRYDSKWMENISTILAGQWCKLHKSLATSPEAFNKFDIMTWLSTMAFHKSADMDAILALGSFYRLPDLAQNLPPDVSSFMLSFGDTFSREKIIHIIEPCKKDSSLSPGSTYPKLKGETTEQHHERKVRLFEESQEAAQAKLILALESQWPCQSPTMPHIDRANNLFDIPSLKTTVKATFKAWYDNLNFDKYLTEVAKQMERQAITHVAVSKHTVPAPQKKQSVNDDNRHIGMGAVFAEEPVILQDFKGQAPKEPRLPKPTCNEETDTSETFTRLEDLCATLDTQAVSDCNKDYVQHLRTSYTALQSRRNSRPVQSDTIDDRIKKKFETHLENCEEFFQEFSSAFLEMLTSERTSAESLAFRLQLGPRISPSFWLKHLNQEVYELLPRSWQKLIIEYGCTVTHLQRAQRLHTLSSRPIELAEEYGHRGHINWDPEEFPETLLLEAESGIMVRKEQELIAQHMRQPTNGDNSVVQLMMGGGKSSTIVPVVAACLADKQSLVRIIVGKPQSAQMLHILISKLSGLLGRRIYQMPFSRDLQIDVSDADTIRAICQECITTRGIMLIQPENILSFRLMGIECCINGQSEIASSLLDTQEFLDQNTRDIIDESDENLSPRFELVYTMGSQRSVEFAPDRWVIVQEILSWLPEIATQIKAEMSAYIQLDHNSHGRFPRLRILRADAAERLSTLLATQVIDRGLKGIPIRSQSPALKRSIFRYITRLNLDPDEIDQVESHAFWSKSTMQPLLLLRGLIAGGMLSFAFSSKRWRVNYGLDSSRVPPTKTAVPYKSKDSPSLRSEFSHPDIVIILTCLSYYYEGLPDEYLFEAFEHVLKSDQAAIHYNEWVASASPDLPASFRHLSGISIRDRESCITKIFPALRYSKNAIDYYLSHFCFKRELKEFPSKLSASGWDLGASKTNPTTGFSGTNDTSHVLPIDVKHIDLPSQTHTNAEVLGYLLQDESSIEYMPPLDDIDISDAERLLQLIGDVEHGRIRVLLDVGAQVLDRNNREVAALWLQMNQQEDVSAVVFFEEEEISILDRDGRTESFQTSPFSKQLGQCLVYLDEAHTRGTDLKLPRDYRAAVTLGAGLTKDRLVQACMRLRQLGKGQSVSFIVPQDIRLRILERNNKAYDASIEVADILCWSIGETWNDLRRSMSLWAVQGHRFEMQKNLLHGGDTTKEDVAPFLEDEAQTLEARYRPKTEGAAQFAGWDTGNGNIAKIIAQCQNFQATNLSLASLSEEQERELSPEIQQERQVERPARLHAREHTLHPDIEKLVRTGKLPTSSKAFESAFRSLRSTSAARLYDTRKFPSDVLITRECARTVKVSESMTKDSFISDVYLRPAQFVISIPSSGRSKIIKSLILISSYEANLLLPTIRASKKVTLHLFAARHNASFAALDTLDLWHEGKNYSASSLSQDLKMQLNLFCGSLYLKSFEEYTHLCDALGLLRGTVRADQHVSTCGFIKPPVSTWGLNKSPVPFLRVLLLKIRREGDGVDKTHLGKILNALPLEESDFEREPARLREVTPDVSEEFRQHTQRGRNTFLRLT